MFWLGHFCRIALILKQHAGVLATKNFITDLQRLQAANMGLPAGAHVRISGLISRPELNGSQGVVLHFDHKKARYAVQLADRKEMLLKPECIKCT